MAAAFLPGGETNLIDMGATTSALTSHTGKPLVGLFQVFILQTWSTATKHAGTQFEHSVQNIMQTWSETALEGYSCHIFIIPNTRPDQRSGLYCFIAQHRTLTQIFWCIFKISQRTHIQITFNWFQHQWIQTYTSNIISIVQITWTCFFTYEPEVWIMYCATWTDESSNLHSREWSFCGRRNSHE